MIILSAIFQWRPIDFTQQKCAIYIYPWNIVGFWSFRFFFMGLLDVLTEMCVFVNGHWRGRERGRDMHETTNTARKLHPDGSRKVHYGRNPHLTLLWGMHCTSIISIHILFIMYTTSGLNCKYKPFWIWLLLRIRLLKKCCHLIFLILWNVFCVWIQTNMLLFSLWNTKRVIIWIQM